MKSYTQQELENKIIEAQKAYYDGCEKISDEEFDSLWALLEKDYPDSSLLNKIGEDTIKGEKVTHTMMMGSQSKFNTYEGLCDWIKKENISFPIVIQSKVDGNSALCQYEDGRLKVAASRGNGIIGENITRVLRNIVPTSISYSGKVSVRGEVVMNRDLFDKKYSKDFKNPRNLTAGLLKNESFQDFSDLRFIAYDTNKSFETEIDKYTWLESMGFEVVDNYIASNIQEVEDYHNKRNSKDMPFDIDGLVLKQNIIDPDDATEYRPKKQHAYKWESETAETVLTGVDWSLTGGTLTPVAEFAPVELDGTTVKQASLSNPSFIVDNNLKIGDVIEVCKRGMIIPHVERILEHCGTQDIEIPTKCPVCGSELVMREGNTKLYCDNRNCKTVTVARLNKWIDVLDVKGFGPAMIDSLVFDYDIESVDDLYDRDFIDNFFCKTYGSINARKAFDDLYKKSEGITLAQFIAGYNLGNIGLDMAQTIVDAGFDTWNKVYNELSSDKLLNIEGWSDIRCEKFLEAFTLVKDEMNYVSRCVKFKETKKVSNSGISGLHICVTGKLEHFSRKEVEAFLEENGAVSDSSVTSKTDILVTNDQTSGSSKLKNAAKFGTKIINEEELIALCGTV